MVVGVFRIGTVRYNWPMSAHASQTFSIARCTDSEDLPDGVQAQRLYGLAQQNEFEYAYEFILLNHPGQTPLSGRQRCLGRVDATCDKFDQQLYTF